jgi:hypothetical protein
MDPSSFGNQPALTPGDVLLFHGHGFVSWAIRRFDESDVDRAAIVLRPETMAEATASGLRHIAIEPAVQSSAFTYVRRLVGAVDPMTVAEQALAFTTDRPPTDDRIVMLAMLAMTRRLPLGERTLRHLLCVLLDRASRIAERLRVRHRGLVFSSEFVYRCFERTGDPRSDLEVRQASPDGHGARSPVTDSEAMLWEWASRFSDPTRRTPRRPKEPLEPLIAAFARVDSPNDPIVPRSYVADAAIVGPGRPVDDEELITAAVRFRDAIVRLTPTTGARDPTPGQPWTAFFRIAPFVTPGDLRYTHSLRTVTSLRPTERKGRTSVEPGSPGERADQSR